MMAIYGVNHVTLRCAPEQLQGVQLFYERYIGLAAGPRPSFDFPGAWLYAGTEAVVHLAAVLKEPVVDMETSPTVLSAASVSAATTGPIDHIAFRVGSAVEECRRNLTAHGIAFTEAPVPDFPIHQLFLCDPLGVKIELNFVQTP